jgi:hypothetical protein
MSSSVDGVSRDSFLNDLFEERQRTEKELELDNSYIDMIIKKRRRKKIT